MSATGTQVNATRNQSTLLIDIKHIFLFDNRYDVKTINNDTAAAEITLKPGTLLFKLSATEVDALDAAANIANVVGISANETDIVLADDATATINMATEGTVAEGEIILPGGVTLETVIPTTQLTLRDRLNELGFHLETAVEHTKHDNN